MTAPRDAEETPPRGSLARAFWGGLVVGGVVLALVPLALSFLGAGVVAKTIAFFHATAALAYAVVVPIWVWRAARTAPRAPRLAARAVVASFYAAIVAALGYAIDGYEDYRVSAQVESGVRAVDPVRDALADACRDGTLAAGSDRERLGLEAPPAYVGPYTRAVELRVASPVRAGVVVTFAALPRMGLLGEYPAVRDGDTLEIEGRCVAGAMLWTLGGTLDRRYHPRLTAKRGR